MPSLWNPHGRSWLRREPADGAVVVGVGEPLVRALGARIAGLRGFTALSGVGVAFPSTQGALWVYVRGDQREAAVDAALVGGEDRRLAGGSFVAVQRFVHDLDRFPMRCCRSRAPSRAATTSVRR